MNTRIVMAGSALMLAVLGLAATFLPQELLKYLHLEPVTPLPVVVQLLGAAYLGIAFMNWMAKGILIGGIYARPLAMGNFLHFFAGAMALLKATAPQQVGVGFWVVVAGYAVFAALFGWITFRHPLKVPAA